MDSGRATAQPLLCAANTTKTHCLRTQYQDFPMCMRYVSFCYGSSQGALLWVVNHVTNTETLGVVGGIPQDGFLAPC